MEKKFVPTPELKAKVEEIRGKLDNEEMKPLDPEALDVVSGGQGAYVENGVVYLPTAYGVLTVDEFCDIVKWMYDNYGEDIAIGTANELFYSALNEPSLRTGGPEYLRDRLKSKYLTAAENGVAWG